VVAAAAGIAGRSTPGEVRPVVSAAAWHSVDVIEFTEWAVQILSKAETAARRFNPDARIRLLRDGAGVRFELADEADPRDDLVQRDGFSLLVERGLEGIVDVVEPHDRLILRPPGSTERSVRDHH
jgi:hypothetical protein